MNKAILAIATAMSIAGCAARQDYPIAANAYEARIMELNVQSIIHEASHDSK